MMKIRASILIFYLYFGSYSYGQINNNIRLNDSLMLSFDSSSSYINDAPGNRIESCEYLFNDMTGAIAGRLIGTKGIVDPFVMTNSIRPYTYDLGSPIACVSIGKDSFAYYLLCKDKFPTIAQGGNYCMETPNDSLYIVRILLIKEKDGYYHINFKESSTLFQLPCKSGSEEYEYQCAASQIVLRGNFWISNGAASYHHKFSFITDSGLVIEYVNKDLYSYNYLVSNSLLKIEENGKIYTSHHWGNTGRYLAIRRQTYYHRNDPLISQDSLDISILDFGDSKIELKDTHTILKISLGYFYQKTNDVNLMSSSEVRSRIVFSAKDSFIYFNYDSTYKIASKFFSSISMFRLSTKDSLTHTSLSKPFFYSTSFGSAFFFIGPDEKMYGYKYVRFKNGNYFSIKDESINPPSVIDITKLLPISYIALPYPTYYQKISFLDTQICDSLKLTMDCDKRFSRAEWQIYAPDSSYKRFGKGITVRFKPNKTGWYFVKIKALTPYDYALVRSRWVYYKAPPVAIIDTLYKRDTLCDRTTISFTNLTDTVGHNLSFTWDFGDGGSAKGYHASHVYTKAGAYSVVLKAESGDKCYRVFDTLKIIVKERALASIATSDSVGCEPFTPVFTWSTPKVGYLASWQVGTQSDTGTVFRPILDSTGKYKVMLVVSKPGFCNDTAYQNIIVHPSLDQSTTSDLPWLHGDSLTWSAVKGAALYQVYGNGKKIAQIRDTFYTQEGLSTSSPLQIQAVDSCGNLGTLSIAVSPIVLNVVAKNDDGCADLSFNAYAAGVKQCVEVYSDSLSTWQTVYCSTSTEPWCDTTFGSQYASKSCYRVRTEDVRLPQPVYSAQACIIPKPYVYVPNAFSPNGDENNQVWQPRTRGLKSIQVSVYNRWGQLLYTTSKLNDAGWDGAGAPEGVYHYQLLGRGMDGKLFVRHGTITLLK